MQNDRILAVFIQTYLHFAKHCQIADLDPQRFQRGFFSCEAGRIAQRRILAGATAFDFFAGEDSVLLPPIAAREFLRDTAVFQQIYP